MKTLLDRTLTEHIRALEAREYSSLELTRAYLDRIEEIDSEIGAYLFVNTDEALKQAVASDLRRRRGDTRSILDGIPYGAKDNLCTKGIPTTCGSRYLEHYVPPYSATVIERLAAAGCVFLGKLNMDEFAMGSTTEHSAFHPTKNPHDPTCSPGGSSGGSAAALAANEAVFTLGSDTGGSIRQPASHCGAVGIKPTYGSVSRYGLCAFASSLEQIGPLTRTVSENATILSFLQGQDPRDATSRSAPVDSREHTIALHTLRIGLPRELFSKDIAPEVRSRALDAAHMLEKLGALVEEVSLPSLTYAAPTYYILSAAEASSNLARMDGVRFGRRAEGVRDPEALYCRTRSEGFGEEVKRRILLGTFFLSRDRYDEYYKKAFRAKLLIQAEMTSCFANCHLLLSPTAFTSAPQLGIRESDPAAIHRRDLCTVPANLAGIPALTVPFGKDCCGLPIGVQLMGPLWSEPLLYKVGEELERIRAKEWGGR
ncbi:MAG: Asp-tRNA(Asn)/Glu-tRNA(Gln) amidotransferase subunit GatA [Clostridia bacterium]|nr:Asp-tRNA(Asn)/Glu-tRNA(Gln) amidotransferase subunit GatA [Clostridia bacterium]